MLCTYLVYNTDRYYDRKKKVLVGEKKSLVISLAGARLLLRPEKKVLVVCLAGARSLLRLEKKKIQSSVYRRLEHFYSGRNSGDYDRKKKVPVVCLAGRRLLLRPEKKKF